MPSSKSIFSQFFSGALSIGTARVFTILFGLISTIVAVRYIPTDEYGGYILMFVLVSFLVEFTSFGLSLAISKYMAGNGDEHYTHILINTVFYFRLLVFIGLGLLGYLFRPLLETIFGESIWFDFFWFLLFWYGFGSFFHLYNSILRGQQKFKAIGITEFISKGTDLLALVVLVLVFNLGIHALVISKLISGAVSVVLAHRATRMEFGWVYDFNLLKQMLKFGFPLQMVFILDFVYSRLDTVVVGSLLGASGVAFYEVARKIPDTLMQMYAVFVSVYFPISADLFTNDKKEKAEHLLNHSVRILMFLGIFGALIAVVFGKDIIVLLFSDKYLDSYVAFVLLMISTTLLFMESTLGYSLIAVGDSNKPLIVNVVRATISLLGYFVVLPSMGFVGAALISIVGNVVAVPLDVFFLLKNKVKPGYAEFFKPFSIFLLLSFFYLILGSSSFLLNALIVLLYIPHCYGLSVFTLEDIRQIYGEAKKMWLRIAKVPELGS